MHFSSKTPFLALQDFQPMAASQALLWFFDARKWYKVGPKNQLEVGLGFFHPGPHLPVSKAIYRGYKPILIKVPIKWVKWRDIGPLWGWNNQQLSIYFQPFLGVITLSRGPPCKGNRVAPIMYLFRVPLIPINQEKGSIPRLILLIDGRIRLNLGCIRHPSQV